MSRLNDYIQYAVNAAGCALEMYHAYWVIIDQSGRGKHKSVRMDFLTDEQRWNIGYAYVTQGEKAACGLVKRYDRIQRKNNVQYITYGFVGAKNPRIFFYAREFSCRIDAPLLTRLIKYKRIKEQILIQKCRVERLTQFTLDGQYRPIDIERIYDEVDIKKPITVYFFGRKASPSWGAINRFRHTLLTKK